MSWLKNQVDDWKYLISKDNSTSRGFYLFVTIVFAVLFVVFTATLVMAVMGVTSGVLRIVGFAGLPVILLMLIVFMSKLSK